MGVVKIWIIKYGMKSMGLFLLNLNNSSKNAVIFPPGNRDQE